MTSQVQEAESVGAPNRHFARGVCIFCGDQDVSGLHYGRRHRIKVSDYVNVQLKGKTRCKMCRADIPGNIHRGIRHLVQSHPETLERLGIEIPILQNEFPNRVNYQEALQALGFESGHARHIWIEQHTPEIKAYIEAHGKSAARKYFHLSWNVVRRIGDMEQVVPGEVREIVEDQALLGMDDLQAAVSAYELLEMTLRVNSEVLEIVKGEYRNIEDENAYLRERLAGMESRVADAESRAAAADAEKERIIELYNEGLIRKRGAATVSLGQLRDLYGLGPDGTRRSYQRRDN